jgi:hypothetical protein
MSTRTQVQVTDGEEKLTLYHHTDGYPSYMLRIIKEAWEKYGKGWEGARVGKVASMLCAVDPVVFEPMDSHDLNCDIEYYYVIDCKGELHTQAKPIWKVKTHVADFDFDRVKTNEQRLHILGDVEVNKIDDEYIESLEAKQDSNVY